MSTELVHRFLRRLFINPDEPLPSPLPNPIDGLMFKFFPQWRKKLLVRRMNRAVEKTKMNYARQLKRIRAKFNRGEKIRVMFIVKEPAKWKTDSLFQEMLRSGRFEPVIGLTHPSVVYGVPPSVTARKMEAAKEWFESNGRACQKIYDAGRGIALSLKPFQPDIVFYPEVWYDNKKHSPAVVSGFALTCYIPYFVPNYVVVNLDCLQEMHRLYWRHIVFNSDLVKLYSNATKDRSMAGEFVGLGHTMFDTISMGLGKPADARYAQCVIYAPHWTFDHPGNKCSLHYSTFAKNGRMILEYAKQHPEMKWVFKPHPSLRDQLKSSGFMTKEAIDAYYSEWERIGEVCLSGDYNRLFADSYAMITDCGSFLSEYGATKHPVIHLISSKNDVKPPETIKHLYDTYYQAHNEDELAYWLRRILENKEDPNREKRLNALNELGFCRQDAARNIIGYLNGIFTGDQNK